MVLVSQTRYNRASQFTYLHLNSKLKKKFRAIGHSLNPVVTVAGNGLTDSVLGELNRALDDHELIKVRIVGARKERDSVTNQISKIEATEIIQKIGGVLLVYRPTRKPTLALSNILRSNLL